VRIASGAEEFLAALEQALEEGRGPEPATVPWSWDECAAQVSGLIESALAE
jgi:hypothetical protein